eukprot:m.366057 g.366057  ORF g.366057 m.366057 type:complete len:369 (+) comp20821_c0_seq2:1175-2281(+)
MLTVSYGRERVAGVIAGNKTGGWVAAILNIPAVTSSTTFIFDEGEMCNSANATPSAEHLQAIAKLKSTYNIDTQWNAVLSSYGKVNLVYTLEELQPRGTWQEDDSRTFHFVGAMLEDGNSDVTGSGDAVTRSSRIIHATDDTHLHGGSHSETLDAATAFLDSEAAFLDCVRQHAQTFPNVVYVSLGTAIASGAKFWKIIRRAFAALDDGTLSMDTLLVLSLGKFLDSPGSETILEELNAAGNIIAAKRVPQQALLASGLVKVFITHAGMNSVHESLWNGIPMICIPHTGDQPYNANVVEEQRCGVMIDVYDVTVARLRAAYATIFADTTYIAAAQAIRDRLRRCNGPQRAAKIILDCATAHRSCENAV